MRYLKQVFITIFALAHFFLISASFHSPAIAGCQVEQTAPEANEEQIQVTEGPTPPYPYYNNNYNNGYNNNYNNDCNNNFNNGYNNEYDNGYNNGYIGDPGGQNAVNPTPTDAPAVVGGQTGNSGDPCAPGNSYFGPYCGWSPGITDYKHDPVNNVSLASASINDPGDPGLRIGGFPSGLSDTGSFSLTGLSNIFFLTGIFCFFMYLLPAILRKDE